MDACLRRLKQELVRTDLSPALLLLKDELLLYTLHIAHGAFSIGTVAPTGNINVFLLFFKH